MKEYTFWSDGNLFDRFAKMRAACENHQWKEMSVKWMKQLHKKAVKDYFEMRKEFNSNPLRSGEFIREFASVSVMCRFIPKYLEEVENHFE